MILAATRIHIEDLARLGKYQTPPRPFPNVKAKSMIPVTLKVGSLHVLYFILLSLAGQGSNTAD